MGYQGFICSDVDKYTQTFQAHKRLLEAARSMVRSQRRGADFNAEALADIGAAGKGLAELGGEELLFAAYLSISEYFHVPGGEQLQKALLEELEDAMALAKERKPSEWRRAFKQS